MSGCISQGIVLIVIDFNNCQADPTIIVNRTLQYTQIR
jgi:hypothetical protein